MNFLSLPLWLFLPLFLFFSNHAYAMAYATPVESEALIGQVIYSHARTNESVSRLALRYDIGHDAVQHANPHLDPNETNISNAPVKIPSQYILPPVARRGIIVNLPEMRMYYFPDHSSQVLTYPIGIGKVGKNIPVANASIIRKTKNPIWIPPEDIRDFNREKGIILPQIMQSGPDNPLGLYAIYLSLPTFLIHSTPFPESIGRRASFGCIRMYESDIQEFFPSIERGVPVAIINSPIKLGWQENKLYMEAHRALAEDTSADPSSKQMLHSTPLPKIVHLITYETDKQPILVNWQLVSYLARTQDGIPYEIGRKIP